MSDYYASDDSIASPSDATVAGEWSIAMMNGAFRDNTAVTLGYAPNPFRTYEPAIFQYSDLQQHVAVTGATGYGKSTFIQNGLRQVADNGHGFCYVSDGDDIRRVAQRLPEERTDDVYYVGETDEGTRGFNVLGNVESDLEQDILVRRVIKELKRSRRSKLEGRTEEAFSELLHAALESEQEHTLEVFAEIASSEDLDVELPLEDVDERYRREIADVVQRYLQSERARELLCDTSRSRDLATAVREGDIILVERPSVNKLLGEVIAGIAIARVYAAKAGGADAMFTLAVDEVGRYGERTDFSRLLSEGRSLGLSIWLSAQYVTQLNQDRQRAIYANCGTIASFNAGDTNDANALSTTFGEDVSRNDLLQLDRYEALVRMPSSERAVTVHSFPRYPVQREQVEWLFRR